MSGVPRASAVRTASTGIARRSASSAANARRRTVGVRVAQRVRDEAGGDHRRLRERDQRVDGAHADVLVARREPGADRRDRLIALEVAQRVERGAAQLGLLRAERGPQRRAGSRAGCARTIACVAATRTSGGPLDSARSSSTRASSSAIAVELRDDLELHLRCGLRIAQQLLVRVEQRADRGRLADRIDVGPEHERGDLAPGAAHPQPAGRLVDPARPGPGANAIAVSGPMPSSIVFGRRAPSTNHALIAPSSPAENSRRGCSRPASSTISGPSTSPRTAAWWP